MFLISPQECQIGINNNQIEIIDIRELYEFEIANISCKNIPMADFTSRISELEDMEFEVEFEFPKGYDKLINTSILESFNIKENYYECLDRGQKGKDAVENSLNNHFDSIIGLAKDQHHALSLVELLQEHIEHRLKNYTRCIAKSTDNYLKYLLETYNRQLRQKLRAAIVD